MIFKPFHAFDTGSTAYCGTVEQGAVVGPQEQQTVACARFNQGRAP